MHPLQSAPPGGDRVKVSENLGATSVAPVAPVDTSLTTQLNFVKSILDPILSDFYDQPYQA